MTDAPRPRVTIGMPIRNEARFIATALADLTAQDYPYFDILISDNASDDGTAEICAAAAATDSRIRYHRHAENLGAAANFDFVLRQASGDYFLWASGHDRWAANFIGACVARLEAQPDAVLAFANTHWIDAEGNPHPRQSGSSDTRGLTALARYLTVFLGPMNPILGVIRRTPLAARPLYPIVGLDLLIVLRLAMAGDFVRAPDTDWYRREFRREAHYAQKLERYRTGDYGLVRSFWRRLLPLAELPVRILGELWTGPLSVGQKLMLTAVLLPGLPVKYLADRNRRRVT